MGRQRIYMNDRGDCVISGSGFSWFAAFLSPIWALHRRLYLLAVVLMVAGGAMNFLPLTTTAQIVVIVAQLLICGSLANRVHRWLLERRGWRVTAEEPEPRSGGT
jgi:hypothetical protein